MIRAFRPVMAPLRWAGFHSPVEVVEEAAPTDYSTKSVIGDGTASNEYLVASAHNSEFEINTNDTVSISWWAYYTSISGFGRWMAMRPAATGTITAGWEIYVINGVPHFLLVGSTGTLDAAMLVSASMPLNRWLFFSMTYSGATGTSSDVKWYLDGLPTATSGSGTASGTTTSASNKLHWFAGNSNYIAGAMDNAAFHTSVLTAAQVLEAFGDRKPVDWTTHTASASLAEYWPIGEADTYPTVQGGLSVCDMTMTNMESADLQTDAPDGVSPYIFWCLRNYTSADYAAATDNAIHNFGKADAYSLDAWVVPTNGSEIDLISKGTSSLGWTLYYHGPTNSYRFLVVNSGTYTIITSATAKVNGALTHIAVTKAASSSLSSAFKIYINGSDVTASVLSNDIEFKNSSAPLKLLGSSVLAAAAGWELHNARFYAGEWSAANVTTLYNSGVIPSQDEISGVGVTSEYNWKLNDTGSTVYDKVGSNNLTNYGSGAYRIRTSIDRSTSY